MRYASGQLDQRVQLQAKSRTPDGYGGATEVWTTYATVWAQVRPMSGRERESLMRTEGQSDYLITIRYRTDVNETHRILWNSRYFNIRFPKDRKRSAWLEIEAQKGVIS